MDADGLAALLSPEGQALLDALPAYEERAALALGERLRREHPAELVAAALTQSRLRARAEGKFGAFAAGMWFTNAGLEQATRLVVAAQHASRFVRAGIGSVADLCCGIGGDAMALASFDRRVLAVDADPLVAAAAALNLRHWPAASVRCEDVRLIDPGDLSGLGGAFIDPARRGPGPGAGRRLAPEAWSPPWSFVLELAAGMPATGAKVAPGIPHGLVPPGAEAQWVSVGGDVVEASVWFGPLRSPGVSRSALLLGTGGTGAPVLLTEAELDPAPPVGPVGRWLYEPDGAVIRSHLVAAVVTAVGGRLVDPSIAYVTADTLVRTPLAAAYEVLGALPFQLKRLRAALRERGVGHVVVKKRGSAIDPDELRRQLRLPGGGESMTVVLTRVAGVPWALLCRPAADAPGA